MVEEKQKNLYKFYIFLRYCMQLAAQEKKTTLEWLQSCHAKKKK